MQLDRYQPFVSSLLTGHPAPAQLPPVSELFLSAPHPAEALAGLYLFLDRDEAAHGIVQDLSSREAAFWHGILHRREPDPSNAAYWFRRVGAHPVFPALFAAAAEAGYPATGRVWDPFAWIDYWESGRRQPDSPQSAIARAVERIEWEILFAHCALPRL